MPYSQAEGDINLPAVSEKQWIVAQVSLNTASDVDLAVEHAQVAFGRWKDTTIKQRAAIMFRSHELID